MNVELTTFLAIWGAFVSTLVFGWNLYRDLTDRGSLHVSPSVSQLVGGALVPRTEPRRIIHLRITNRGRRQLWITNVGGRFARREGFIITTRNPVPMKLEPGALIDETVPVTELVDDALRIVWFAAYDSTGREYRSSSRDTRETIKGLLELQGREASLGLRYRLRARTARIWASLRALFD